MFWSPNIQYYNLVNNILSLKFAENNSYVPSPKAKECLYKVRVCQLLRKYSFQMRLVFVQFSFEQYFNKDAKINPNKPIYN